MGAGYKFDHPPLLAPGRHYLTLAEIDRLCVQPFSPAEKRKRLFDALSTLVDQFIDLNIPCEFWIDGSFLTKKSDPADVDIAVRLDYDVSQNLTAAQRLLVDSANEAEYIDGIDSYVFTAYPRDHPSFGTDVDERDTWAEQWGLEHSLSWLKGLVVLRLGETSVGLRIRR